MRGQMSQAHRMMHCPDVPILGGPSALVKLHLTDGLRGVPDAIERIVLDSYVSHPMRHRTSQEDGRRAAICVRWFASLVNENRWDRERALSSLRAALATELDGKTYTPSRLTRWAPDMTLVSE